MKRTDIVEATGLCYTTIYNMEKQGQFPARRQLTPGRVAWLRSEVEAWINSRAALPNEPAAELEELSCFGCSDPCALDDPKGIIPASCVLYAT